MNRDALFLLGGAALLGVLFVYFKTTSTPATTEPVVAAPAAPAVRAPRVFDYSVIQHRREAGPERIELAEGEQIVLRVASDADDELHLHGYDQELELKANVPGELKVTADRAGRYEFELHHAHIVLGVLEIQPHQGP